MRSIRPETLVAILALFSAGCFGGFSDDDSGTRSSCASATSDDDDDDDDADHDPRPDPEETLEESDLYRLDGNRLYVYSYSKGLAVLDVANPSAPALLGELALAGPAGELYAEGGRVALLLDSAADSPCETQFGEGPRGGELVLASGLPLSLDSRTCLAGTPVASRRLGDRLYLVTASGSAEYDSSWVYSIDIADPAAPVLVDSVILEGSGASEIHLGPSSLLYIAQPDFSAGRTHVSILELADEQDELVLRGSVSVGGMVPGRFHMDEHGAYFRIVTFDFWSMETELHVVDVADPSAPAVVASLEGIAPWEDLHATRFDGSLAYVVTFEQTDPLWVIDLREPTAPVIVAGLIVPGWSDYLFPRGSQLVAVGRGQFGGVGLSLFDVSDPENPQTLSQVEFGSWLSSSEANADFRGVTILDPGTISADAVVSLPVNVGTWDEDGDFTCTNELHLVAISEGSWLDPRGMLPRSAKVRRSFPVDGHLYAITDLEVSVLDTTDLATPQALASIPVGDESRLGEQCFADFASGGGWGDDMAWGDGCGGGCSLALARPSRAGAPALLLLAALALAPSISRRRRASL